MSIFPEDLQQWGAGPHSNNPQGVVNHLLSMASTVDKSHAAELRLRLLNPSSQQEHYLLLERGETPRC